MEIFFNMPQVTRLVIVRTEILARGYVLNPYTILPLGFSKLLSSSLFPFSCYTVPSNTFVKL